VILQARELSNDHADVFSAFGRLKSGELLDRQSVSPVVRHRTEIIETIGVGHVPEIRSVLADFFVVAMKITEDGLELYDRFTVEHDIHSKDAVGGRVVRPHRNFEQIALRRTVLSNFRRDTICSSSAGSSHFADLSVHAADHRPVIPSIDGQ
jgi:hypothetical protein